MDQKNRHVLAIALMSALLSACGGGGGGGGVRDSVPPPVVPPPPAPPPPAPAPTCQDANASNYGGALPCTYAYTGMKDNLLVPTGANQVHSSGIDGAGVKIGVLDDARIDGYAPIDGKVASYKDYTGQGAEPASNTKRGHGTAIAAIIAGTAAGDFKGGVAPRSSLYWGQVCYNDFCNSQQLTSALTELTGQGVRLFNYSVGGYVGEGAALEQFATGWGAAATPLLRNDGLMVVATGNDGKAVPGGTAAVPAYRPEFLRNWLAVSAVSVDSAGKPSGMPSFANQCGLAAQWCLTAPSLTYLPAIPGTQYQGGIDGTSAATGNVTGVAALVWQVFPWMSAGNVQQTLLTTATDLGAPGVDATYGWGMVNAAKAVKGPGQFVSDFTANVGGAAVFSNDITGLGGLTKAGSGTLSLIGANSYAGVTRVVSGTLDLQGSVKGDLLVQPGATLKTANGSIAGNFTPAAGANTAVQLGTLLTVGGTANLNGSLMILPEASGYTVKATETFLKAGAVSGKFSEVKYGSGLFWNATLNYTSTDVTGTMTRTSVAAQSIAVGASAASIAGGTMTDALINTPAGLSGASGSSLIGKLQSIPTQEGALDALATLPGQIHGTARALTAQQALNDGEALASRARAGAKSRATWVQIDGADGQLARVGYDTARYHQSGARVGVDVPLENLTIGGFVGSSRVRAEMPGAAGRVDSNGATAGGYARIGMGADGYLAGSLSYARRNGTVDRLVVGAPVSGRRSDTVMEGRVEGGIALPVGVTPYAALGALRARQNAFAEKGVGGLAANSTNLKAGFAELGLRYDHTMGAWTVGTDLAARRLLSVSGENYTAWFADAPAAAFVVSGQPLPRNALRLDGHAFYKMGDRWVWYVTLGAEQASGQSRNTFGTAGFRVAF